MSEVRQCVQESKVKLSYQACPDIDQTESKEEVLTCLGHWADDRDASQSFLIATLDFRYRRTLEDRLRCFLIKQARVFSQVEISKCRPSRIRRSEKMLLLSLTIKGCVRLSVS